MARDLLIGNGSLVLGFDAAYRLADFYFPHVGLENHAGERLHPHTGAPLSVSPFSWSHAQVVSVVRGYLDRLGFLRRNRAENTARMQVKNVPGNSVDKPPSFS